MRSSRQNSPVTPGHSRSSHTGLQGSRTLLQKDDKRKTRQWVREVLRKYLAKYVRDFLSNRKDIVPSPVTSEIDLSDITVNQGGTGSSSPHGDDHDHVDLHDSFNEHPLEHVGKATNLPDKGKKLAEKNLKMGLAISELTVIEETALGDDRITYLSSILSLGVKYSVGGRPDHFVHWLVKLPSKNFDERNLARVTGVHKREVYFYTTILQELKMWLEFSNLPDSDDSQILTLNVPTCYYAHSQESSDFDIDQESADQFPNAEFTLVLDDLRAQDFGKRHFSIGLTVDEAIEALREIAKFHASSWAMAQHNGIAVIENWSTLLKWEDLYSLYLDMVRHGFRHLHRFRRDYITESTLAELVDGLLNLESKLPTILGSLLRPLPPPAVTTLVHMDLWTDNLLFSDDNSNSSGDGESGANDGMETDQETLPTTKVADGEDEKKVSGRELNCMILDWQMVSLGRISHDLGILMMTSLDGSVRRDHGMFLIKFYYDTFEKIANSFKLEIPFDLSDFIKQYKESCLLATLLSVSRLDLVVSEQSTLQRFFEALEDLRDEQII